MQSLAAKGQIGIKVGAIYLVQQDMSQQSPSSTKSIVDGDRATGPHVQAERLKGGRVRQRGVNSGVASGLHCQAALGVICSG